MGDKFKLPISVTMFGVDPSCLGGVSTLTRILSKRLAESPDLNFEYITTVNQASALRKILCFCRAIKKSTRRFPDLDGIVHIHMADGASILRACVIIGLAKKYKQSIVLHIHCDLLKIREASSSLMKAAIDWAIRHSDHIIVLGTYLFPLFELLEYPLERVMVLPNAVDCPARNRYTTDRQNVLFLGNVTAAKGITDLLDALLLIDDELDKRIVFDLCGKDHMDVVEQVEKRALTNRVHYKGVVKPDEDFFSRYLLNVLPSHHEAMPFSLLEASAQGIPSIASRVGSIPEVIVHDVSGWLFEASDISALAECLKKALLDQKTLLKASEGIYKSMSERYSLDGYLHRLKDLYSKLANQ